ncbi:flagellar biosynthesis anti-sigma factor FlgM [Sphingomonas radiodurans]|uniref:flagellar biosynthesis anti-sigma factor FlgM n=1 Tax=Sphingomonas radiodurans TaxID=2890321 RepID=UPI001E53DFF6|nr:flagellar biosynthesis anti-sigma factor FlgM [Sphingomonas radiodurans]WBH15657.1 flagellar biosynthesis anti-sigma factor FlgM [Sphingomonas radiodurans]
MVDSIGVKPLINDRKITEIQRVAAPAAAVSVAKQPETTQAPTVAAQLSVAAPVDVDRVKKIQQAVAEGNYPLSPTTIADALIAARYEWMSHEQA